MTPIQKFRVRESWTKVLPIQDVAVEIFYGRLFSIYPELAPLFKGDMKEQGEKLMKMLDKAVNSLDDKDVLIEPLKQAGRAHRSYGVKKEDYAKVADCLFWTFKKGLGRDFDDPTREAWAEVYATVSDVMVEGAGYEDTPDDVQVRKLPWLKRIMGRATACWQAS